MTRIYDDFNVVLNTDGLYKITDGDEVKLSNLEIFNTLAVYKLRVLYLERLISHTKTYIDDGRITIEEAFHRGFEVDEFVNPPVAYKGKRYDPTEVIHCYTKVEAAILNELKKV